MNLRYKKILFPSILATGSLLLPLAVFAQGTIQSSLWIFIFIIHFIAIPVAVGIALVFFFWGLVKFLTNADDEQARADGKKVLIWGIIALFVILSIWGIISVLQDTLFSPILNPALPPN